MKEIIIANLKRTSVNSHFLRLIVGCYIAYLGASVLWEMINGEPKELLAAVLAGVLVLCGGVIAGVCIYALVKHLSIENSKKDNDSEQ